MDGVRYNDVVVVALGCSLFVMATTTRTGRCLAVICSGVSRRLQGFSGEASHT
jgi:hypothetical protein